MIETVSRVRPLSVRTEWFAAQPSWCDALALTRYVQSGYKRLRIGFVCRNFQTWIIDLTASEDDIFRQFSKKTQYEIRRARRGGVTCHFDGDAATFRRFHDDAAKRQGRRPIPPGLIESAWSNVYISYARLEDRILVMSCMPIDPTLRRVRGWFGCSCHVPEDSSEDRQLVGRANRLLYSKRCVISKSQGLEIYTMSGAIRLIRASKADGN